MRTLREDERDEIESVKHLIKYVLTKPDIQAYQIWGAILELDKVGKRFVLSGIVTETELSELLELEDMKELMQRFMLEIRKHLELESE